MSQTANAGDPMETARKLSPGLFGIIIILFFLPFVAVTCSGQEMFSLKGLDLVTGTEITEEDVRESEVGEQLTQFEESFGGETEGETSEDSSKVDMQIFAVLALVAAVAGLITGFGMRGRNGAMGAAISGVVGAISLLILRSTFEVEATGDTAEQAGTTEQLGNVVGYDWKIGWTLAFLLFLVAAGLQALHLFRGRPTPSSTSSGHTPVPPTGPPAPTGPTPPGGTPQA